MVLYLVPIAGLKQLMQERLSFKSVLNLELKAHKGCWVFI